MEKVGLEFRATKDIDIVLFAETLDASFVRKFWEFIGAGGYEIKEKDSKKRQLYRFKNPSNLDFPVMLELFSCKQDSLEPIGNHHLTPISAVDSKASLSAILLDDDYYQFIKNGKGIIKEIPIVKPEYLIPLKMKAWLDLTKIKTEEKINIQSNDVKKHKNDVFKLLQIIDPELKLDASEKIKKDIQAFIDAIIMEPPDLKSLKINQVSLKEMIELLKDFYRLN